MTTKTKTYKLNWKSTVVGDHSAHAHAVWTADSFFLDESETLIRLLPAWFETSRFGDYRLRNWHWRISYGYGNPLPDRDTRHAGIACCKEAAEAYLNKFILINNPELTELT